MKREGHDGPSSLTYFTLNIFYAHKIITCYKRKGLSTTYIRLSTLITTYTGNSFNQIGLTNVPGKARVILGSWIFEHKIGKKISACYFLNKQKYDLRSIR